MTCFFWATVEASRYWILIGQYQAEYTVNAFTVIISMWMYAVLQDGKSFFRFTFFDTHFDSHLITFTFYLKFVYSILFDVLEISIAK